MFALPRETLRRGASTRLCRSCLRQYSSEAPRTEKKSRIIFSGIQPTGVPHLGNYLGALREWVKLQNAPQEKDSQRFFSIVDLHAITVRQDPKQLALWRRQMLASFLAVGLDTKKSTLFYQSDVPYHAELMWILSCNASMGYLSRMTQWKSKMSLPTNASPFDLDNTSGSKEALKLGLFAYPVLQAADILLYGTTYVPVGEDQAQHLEFSRELANGFNHSIRPSKPVFQAPQTILSPAKRVMSLKDPTKKMSKSDPDPKSGILITDTKEEIWGKIRTALTDSIEGVSYDRETRPGVSNLIDLMCYMDEGLTMTPQELAIDMKDLSMRALKEKVAETLDASLKDVRERYNFYINSEEAVLRDIAEEAKVRATKTADAKMKEVRKAIGFY
ncbi:tryptophanyl-tRNA synthetase-like protein, partial [Sporormia fimetaria CBS 119925]